MTFPTKIDWWFWATIAFVVGTMAFAFTATQSAARTTELAVLGVSALLGVGLPLWLARSTYYEVSDSEILVRSGPFQWKIERESITAVKESRSMLSSPALSLDRIEITYSSGRKILVSPADKAGFLRAIGHVA